ncbi:MAG: efflux RND transporter permease subunit [Nevskia sp.]|uniref:efflux RND transporter permease subunit n=1 Tax=Nevskia sp. TaxID=1929292 RepID=UPI0040350761
MNRLIEFALVRPLAVLLLALALAAAGVLAWLSLPVDAFPDVSSPQVKIILKAPGMTPEEIEARITAPIEVEMLGLPKQSMLRSTSKYGLADITVDFLEGTDIYWARNQVAERLNGVMADLPAGVSGGVAPLTTPLGEMFMFTIESDTASLAERRRLLDWTIRPALRTVPGVADVNALGGHVESFEVVPSPQALAARGLSFEKLQMALAANNRNDGAGRMSEGEETLLVRTEGSLRTLDDLRAVVLRSEAEGGVVRLGEVAEVRIGSVTRYGGVTRNGSGETVEGLVLGLRGANAREVVAGVRAKLDELRPTLPEGITVQTFYDRGDLVSRAVDTVSKSLIEAVVLVLALLVAFLGNVRAAVAVALILPLSALSTFLLMRLFGISANLMSLGGLAIAIGMLVDAAVVVVENIVARLAVPDPARPRDFQIARAVREVAGPIAVGIVIIILVFLPLLTLQGLEGKLFAPVALTIVFALASSLLLSLTVIPVLAARLLHDGAHAEPWIVRKLAALYTPLLLRALARPQAVIATALIGLLAAGIVYARIGKTFLPTMDEGSLIVQLEKLPSVGLDASLALDSRFQQALLARVPEVAMVVARAGADEIGLDPMGLNQTDTFLALKPSKEWRNPDKDVLADEIRKVLADFPGIAYAFTQPIQMRVSEMILGVRGDVAIRLFGPDLGQLNAKAEAIAAELRGLNGAEDVYYTANSGVQYLRIAVDLAAAGRLGLSVDALEALLRAQIEGTRVGTVHRDGRRLALTLKGPETLRATPALLDQLPIALADGRTVPLSAVARLERVEGPVQVNRELGNRNVVVIANVRGRDLVGFVEEAKAEVAAAVKLDAGYSLSWGGEFENQQRAARRLSIVVPIAIGLIFLLLLSTFGSLRQAALVLLNIPFAMIGGVFALGLSGEYLSVPASVGFIALLGIAVLNGIVLVTCFNQLRADGLSLHEAVVQGAARRLRPVVMTAAIAALGLVPLLFATGPGSEIQRPLAIVVIGGLISSTLLTLILLPILYLRHAFGRVATTGVPA